MTFFIISNGVGRKPHVEEVDSHEDVVTRLETDRESFIVIEGRAVEHYEERILVIDNQEVESKKGDSDGGSLIPRWSPPSTGATEHPRDVGEHLEGAADNAPGNSTDQGPDDTGTGEVSDGSDDDDGELLGSDTLVPATE